MLVLTWIVSFLTIVYAVRKNLHCAKASMEAIDKIRTGAAKDKTDYIEAIKDAKRAGIEEYFQEVKNSRLRTSSAENVEYQKCRADFQQLSLPQKIALRYLITHPESAEFMLLGHLQELGFGQANPVQNILWAMRDNLLIDFRPLSYIDGKLFNCQYSIRTGKAKLIQQLLDEGPLC